MSNYFSAAIALMMALMCSHGFYLQYTRTTIVLTSSFSHLHSFSAASSETSCPRWITLVCRLQYHPKASLICFTSVVFPWGLSAAMLIICFLYSSQCFYCLYKILGFTFSSLSLGYQLGIVVYAEHLHLPRAFVYSMWKDFIFQNIKTHFWLWSASHKAFHWDKFIHL